MTKDDIIATLDAKWHNKERPKTPYATRDGIEDQYKAGLMTNKKFMIFYLVPRDIPHDNELGFSIYKACFNDLGIPITNSEYNNNV
jgi:hypothetical protein